MDLDQKKIAQHKLSYDVPAEFAFAKVYDSEKELSDQSLKYLVRSCVGALKSVIKGETTEALKIYDVVAFALYLIHRRGTSLLAHLNTTQFLELYESIKLIADSLKSGLKHQNSYHILQTVLSFYRLRLTPRNYMSKILDFLGDDCLYMHISSPLKMEILEQRKAERLKK